MGKTKHTTEQIIVKLREAEILCGQGKTIAKAVRHTGVTEQTYYRCDLPPNCSKQICNISTLHLSQFSWRFV